MILYTKTQMEKAYYAGRDRGKSEIVGYDSEFSSFGEYMSTLKPYYIDDGLYKAMKSTVSKMPSGGYPLNAIVIISAVVKATHEVNGVVGITYDQLVSTMKQRRQKDYITTPRLVCYYLCYLHTGLSYTQIGSVFGGRRHDTVLKGARSIYGWMNDNAVIRNLIDRTYDILKEQGFNTDISPIRKLKFKPMQIEKS